MGRKLAVPAPLLYQLLIICSKTAHLEGGRIDRPVRTAQEERPGQSERRAEGPFGNDEDLSRPLPPRRRRFGIR